MVSDAINYFRLLVDLEIRREHTWSTDFDSIHIHLLNSCTLRQNVRCTCRLLRTLGEATTDTPTLKGDKDTIGMVEEIGVNKIGFGLKRKYQALYCCITFRKWIMLSVDSIVLMCFFFFFKLSNYVSSCSTISKIM